MVQVSFHFFSMNIIVDILKPKRNKLVSEFICQFRISVLVLTFLGYPALYPCPIVCRDRFADFPHCAHFLGYTRTRSYSRSNNRPLSYSRCRELFHDALRRIGENPLSFGLHSNISNIDLCNLSVNSGPCSLYFSCFLIFVEYSGKRLS